MSALLLGVLSGAAFRLGFVRRKKHPERVFSNEAVLFAAVLLCAGAVVFLGRALDSGGRDVLLFENEWTIGWAVENNEGLAFSDIAPRV